MKPTPFNTKDTTIYRPHEIDTLLAKAVCDGNLKGNSRGEYIYNIPCAFDIETTSFYRDKSGTYDYAQYMKKTNGGKIKMAKASIMYVWQLGINGYTIVGRTWDEFTHVCDTIAKVLQLSEKKRLIIYVHNLSYEFQFIRKHFEWSKVFATDERKPLYATTSTYIEFRCSYLLSGYSLEKLGSQLLKYKCEKKTGDLDYSLLRHTKTPLTETELGYCINDIKVVMAYIQELIEETGNINNIPLTRTGFVRKYCRKHCLRRKNKEEKTVTNWRYVHTIEHLTISGIEEFDMLQRAYAGGFTHANADYIDAIIKDVDSYDFTSSYPYVMVAEQFPMSIGIPTIVRDEKHFMELIDTYCCIFDIEFTEIMERQTQENYISKSKCNYRLSEDIVENNGRVVCAKTLVTTITNVDFLVIRKFYTWQSMRVGRMYCYKKGYLPTEFVRAILDLYRKKTELKGVDGKEAEYLNSKEMLNSCYGMCVTNPLRDDFTYDGEWDTTKITDEKKLELLETYNNSDNRFLYYAWGVFITAYARFNLFTGIYVVGDDYVYSDTDSIKLMNGDKHKLYFDTYNSQVREKLKRACEFHNLPFEMCEPKTIKGVTKLLGVWDYEGRYEKFKTLGAKRYMVQEKDALKGVDGKTYPISITVAGVDKKHAVPYLMKKYGIDGIFDAFTNYLDLPPDSIGKYMHSYLDFEVKGTITDYRGETCEYDELTGVHLEATGYTLNLAVAFLNYLQGIKFKDY